MDAGAEQLRTEIIEAQKARIDLFKWKIILVAALGAAGLGLGETSSRQGDHMMGRPDFLFCLIPLVCIYVDILCSHLNLRIFVIGRFFLWAQRRGVTPLNQKTYEYFVEQARTMPVEKNASSDAGQEKNTQENKLDAFALEDRALHLSSGVTSLLIFSWGVVQKQCSSNQWDFIFIVAGLLGIALSALAHQAYQLRMETLKELVDKTPAPPAENHG
jgi:hypothetical protein